MTSSEIIAKASSQVGYLEKESNKELDDFTANAGNKNYTKYSRDLKQAGYYGGKSKQGYAWCAQFVDWCFLQVAGEKSIADTIKPNGLYGASCTYAKKYYMNKGRLFKEPQVGDQIFFKKNGSVCHTGIVVGVSSAYVMTVEGNCSNGVRQCTYAINSSYIDSYGRPFYDGKPELHKGDAGVLKKDALVWGKKYKFSDWVYHRTIYVLSVSGNKLTFSVIKDGPVTGRTHVDNFIKI